VTGTCSRRSVRGDWIISAWRQARPTSGSRRGRVAPVESRGCATVKERYPGRKRGSVAAMCSAIRAPIRKFALPPRSGTAGLRMGSAPEADLHGSVHHVLVVVPRSDQRQCLWLGTVTSAPNLVMRGARWSACLRGSREPRPQVVGEVLLVGTPMNDFPPARLGEVVGIGRDDGASVSAVAGISRRSSARCLQLRRGGCEGLQTWPSRRYHCNGLARRIGAT
jgi:hypothetical protein